MADLIHITVHLVGRVAEAAGEPQLEYALVPPAGLATLLELVALRRPEVAQILPACRLSVNGNVADHATPLSDGDEVAIQLQN